MILKKCKKKKIETIKGIYLYKVKIANSSRCKLLSFYDYDDNHYYMHPSQIFNLTKPFRRTIFNIVKKKVHKFLEVKL